MTVWLVEQDGMTVAVCADETTALRVAARRGHGADYEAWRVTTADEFNPKGNR